MNRRKLITVSCLSELTIIILISIANCFDNFVYYIFYNLLYGIAVSTLMPLLFFAKEYKGLENAGIKKPGKRQLFILSAFVIISIAGQLLPKFAASESLPFHILPVAILPLIMTTFFEEFLFRGFFQTHIEQYFGTVPALLLSGLLFSLYHLGYPGFRTANDFLLLFVVGTGFALSFYLSGNNLFVSFFVNLPNAFITYVMKYDQFPVITAESSVWAGLTVLLTAILFFSFKLRAKPAL